MKKSMIILALLLMQLTSSACPVCERNKPKIFSGITHGSNPDSFWDYIIVGVIAVIAILTLYYSVKFLVKPKETNQNHIKYSIINQ